MTDGMDEAVARRNLIERLAAKIPGFRGYLDRELRRDVDKMQRDWLAAEIDRSRGLLAGKIREWSRTGNLANLDRASSIDKLLDRAANRIRHADYGYTGFFDVVKIYEPELDRLYQFDLALTDDAESIEAQIESLSSTASGPQLDDLLRAVESFDRELDRRATVFEDVTAKGGR